MRAEHQVAIDVTLDGGRHVERKLRGVIAVARPDRLRLRALGPAGITLFDLLYVGGDVKVIEAIRDPNASALGEIIHELAGDLSAAFGLVPAPAGRRTTALKDTAIVEEPGRRVRLSRFTVLDGRAVPLRIDIDNAARNYRVGVDVREVALDQTLDPALFKE